MQPHDSSSQFPGELGGWEGPTGLCPIQAVESGLCAPAQTVCWRSQSLGKGHDLGQSHVLQHSSMPTGDSAMIARWPHSQPLAE